MLLAHRWRGKGGTSHPARAGGVRPLRRCGAPHLRGLRARGLPGPRGLREEHDHGRGADGRRDPGGVGAGRPDADDLQAAEQFGRLVGQKILAGDPASVRAADLQDEPSPEASVKRFAAFVREFSARQAASPRPFVPEYRADLCSGCGACIAACPAEAIGSDYAIDPARCIACCACVKACPVQARRFLSPFARPLAENFSLRKSPRWVV